MDMQFSQINLPIEQLLEDYQITLNDDINVVAQQALEYVESMHDSHGRCLLYVLAKKVLQGS